MPRIQITRAAEEDLLAIARYVAADQLGPAQELLDRFDAVFARFAAQPLAGAIYLPRPRYRHFVVGNYVVFYEPEADGIRIARVIHAARDLPTALG